MTSFIPKTTPYMGSSGSTYRYGKDGRINTMQNSKLAWWGLSEYVVLYLWLMFRPTAIYMKVQITPCSKYLFMDLDFKLDQVFIFTSPNRSIYLVGIVHIRHESDICFIPWTLDQSLGTWCQRLTHFGGWMCFMIMFLQVILKLKQQGITR